MHAYGPVHASLNESVLIEVLKDVRGQASWSAH